MPAAAGSTTMLARLGGPGRPCTTSWHRFGRTWPPPAALAPQSPTPTQPSTLHGDAVPDAGPPGPAETQQGHQAPPQPLPAQPLPGSGGAAVPRPAAAPGRCVWGRAGTRNHTCRVQVACSASAATLLETPNHPPTQPPLKSPAPATIARPQRGPPPLPRRAPARCRRWPPRPPTSRQAPRRRREWSPSLTTSPWSSRPWQVRRLHCDCPLLHSGATWQGALLPAPCQIVFGGACVRGWACVLQATAICLLSSRRLCASSSPNDCCHLLPQPCCARPAYSCDRSPCLAGTAP